MPVVVTPTTRDDILRTLRDHRDKIRGFGVRRLGVFGSASRNEATAASDIDVVVDFETKSFDGYMELKFFLEDLFQRKVDLVLADTVKPILRSAIVDQAVYVEGL